MKEWSRAHELHESEHHVTTLLGDPRKAVLVMAVPIMLSLFVAEANTIVDLACLFAYFSLRCADREYFSKTVQSPDDGGPNRKKPVPDLKNRA